MADAGLIARPVVTLFGQRAAVVTCTSRRSIQR
jgi:hypothetical protein